MIKLIAYITTCCTAFLLAGCKNDSQSEHPIQNKGFIYCVLGQPNTFNPQRSDGGLTTDTLSSQLFDHLLQLDPITFEPVAMLATDWQISDDGKSYTFHLRSDVSFQTTRWFTPKRLMNADDVVFSFDRIINPSNPFHHIKDKKDNTDDYPWFSSMNFASLVDDIVALDEHTVRFTLSRPDVSFLSTLATNYAIIHSKQYANELLLSSEQQNIDNHPVGTGPFYLDEYKQNHFIRMKKHANYWGGSAKMEQVVYDINNQGTGMLSKLITHECDILSSPATGQLSQLAKNSNFILNSQVGMNLAYLAVNTKDQILSDLSVRQAINLAINRQALVQSIYHGAGTATSSMIPPISWAYDKDNEVLFDPKLALNLLEKAGYRHGFTLNLLVPLEARPYNPSPRKSAELIRSDLAAIGIIVNIITENIVNSKQLRDNINEIDMVLTGWIADNNDPDNFLRPHLSCDAQFSGWNLSNWCDQSFESLLNHATSINKRDERRKLYLQAQTILKERMPIIPLAHGVQYQAQNISLQGVRLNPFGDNSFVNVSRSH